MATLPFRTTLLNPFNATSANIHHVLLATEKYGIDRVNWRLSDTDVVSVIMSGMRRSQDM